MSCAGNSNAFALSTSSDKPGTGVLLVVYTPLYGEGGLWVRPLSMFEETVHHEGRERPRFEYIGVD